MQHNLDQWPSLIPVKNEIARIFEPFSDHPRDRRDIAAAAYVAMNDQFIINQRYSVRPHIPWAIAFSSDSIHDTLSHLSNVFHTPDETSTEKMSVLREAQISLHNTDRLIRERDARVAVQSLRELLSSQRGGISQAKSLASDLLQSTVGKKESFHVFRDDQRSTSYDDSWLTRLNFLFIDKVYPVPVGEIHPEFTEQWTMSRAIAGLHFVADRAKCEKRIETYTLQPYNRERLKEANNILHANRHKRDSGAEGYLKAAYYVRGLPDPTIR